MWKTRILNLVWLLGLAFLLGVGGWIFSHLRSSDMVPRIRNTASLVQQVQTLSQLVTVKYVMEKVVVLEDVRWYGENRVLIIAHGVVKAGVDLGKLRPEEVRITGTNVTLSLPAPEITDVYLDDKQTQVIERVTGLLRQFDKDLEQSARRQAVDDLRRAARYSGILADAESRAREQLRKHLETFGLTVQFAP
jgi:hypothetical protein